MSLVDKRDTKSREQLPLDSSKNERLLLYPELKFHVIADQSNPYRLESGECISPVTLAYEAYGTLNETGDNAILILHGFTADAHAAGINLATEKIGWWDAMIGPGKAFDTDRFFVVCSNVLGGCSGSTGPTSINPQTGLPYGTSFPIISIGDIVAAQYKLLRALGVNSLAAVSGASMGGQQALQWLISYPDFVRSAVPIACAASLSALGLGLMEVSREAIMSDPEWRSGDYIGQSFPENGLRLARMIAHLSYVSSQFLDVEFGRRLAEDSAKSEALEAKFAIQKYLRDEGDHFIKRFDPNTFLYLSQAIEHFDLTQNVPSLAAAFERVKGRVLLLSFRTDLLFPVSGLRELETSLRDAKVDVDHITVETSFGHDAFLTDWMKISPLIAEFLR